MPVGLHTHLLPFQIVEMSDLETKFEIRAALGHIDMAWMAFYACCLAYPQRKLVLTDCNRIIRRNYSGPGITSQPRLRGDLHKAKPWKLKST